MGYELEAFLGRASELREWKAALPSTVVCRFGGDLGLVPLTGELRQDLRARTGQAEAEKAARAWGAEASGSAAIAYVSGYEFGDQGSEEGVVWSNGKQVLSGSVEEIFRYLRDRAKVDLGRSPLELGRYRKEDAADKWAAAGILEEAIDGADGQVAALAKALGDERKSASIQALVRQFAAEGLGMMGAEARAAIPALIGALQDKGWTVRYAVVEALGKVGAESAEAASALSAARSDEEPLVREAVGKALSRIVLRAGPAK